MTQLLRAAVGDESDEDAYWRLYTRFVIENQALQDRIGRLMPNDRGAEPIDVVADAFEAVVRKARAGGHAEFRDRDKLIGLLTTFAKGRVSDLRRKRRALGEESAFGDAGGARLGEERARAAQPSEGELRLAQEGIEERLAALESEEHREIVRLCVGGKTQSEIAAALGFGSVKRVERALDAIRARWSQEPLQRFRAAWSAGPSSASEAPDVIGHFLSFAAGGKWFLRDIAEVDIHERLRRGWPVSLAALRIRVDPSLAGALDRVFSTQLFFDESPSAAALGPFVASLDDWSRSIVELKLQGMSNRQIAESRSCALSAVSATMQRVREEFVSHRDSAAGG